MSEADFFIEPAPEATTQLQRLRCAGTLDAGATEVIDSLLTIPEGGRVVLNFADVERVNSMGLAQLLKVFEEYENRGIQAKVTNLSRMIDILFQMTGLEDYIAEEGQEFGEEETAAPAPTTAPSAQRSAPTPPPAPKASPKPAVEVPVFSESLATSSAPALQTPDLDDADHKFTFSVALQNTSQLTGWYVLNTFLQRQLEMAMQVIPVYGALGAQKASGDLVYASAFEAAGLIRKQNFIPLLRAANQIDEVSILVRAEDEARNALTDLQPGDKVVTDSADSFVFILGRFLMDNAGLNSAKLRYALAGQEVKAIQALLHSKADVLLINSDTYNGLSSLAKKRLKLIDHSQTDIAFHLLCLAPQKKSMASAVLNAFKKLDQKPNILKDIGVSEWTQPQKEELTMLIRLYDRYSPKKKA